MFSFIFQLLVSRLKIYKSSPRKTRIALKYPRVTPSHFFLHVQLALSICRRLSQAAFNSIQYLVQRGSYLSKPSPAWENLRVQFSIFFPSFRAELFCSSINFWLFRDTWEVSFNSRRKMKTGFANGTLIVSLARLISLFSLLSKLWLVVTRLESIFKVLQQCFYYGFTVCSCQDVSQKDSLNWSAFYWRDRTLPFQFARPLQFAGHRHILWFYYVLKVNGSTIHLP